ncbi:Protein suppressor of hairy wing [Folsomia candida]|uniref:Protein suppressor of hairy wing n=1 Tax=Folsomia candida TaxID=158441 RepID=A0A226DCG1_FOLCA|nr:Protein suppressor of hairy wing [Folsomia candida]
MLLYFPDPSCSSRFFTTHPNLQDHIRRLHKFKIRAERPIKCDICQARFLINNDLTKHLKNHRPRADFTLTCPHCPMLFACPHILRRHLTAEHGVPRVTTAERCRRYNERRKTQAPPGAQPFTCDICHVSYPLKTGLTHHLKKHRPCRDYTLTCSHCPALFATPKGLRCHLTKEHAVPKESNSTRQKTYHALRKQARGEKKAVDKDDKVSTSGPRRSSPSRRKTRSKRLKIEHIPDEEIEIKEEDCVIRDVLSSEGDDDDVADEMTKYDTKVEIKSEDEESHGDLDLDNDPDLSPLSEIKSEQESHSDMESEHHDFKMLTFHGYSSSEDGHSGDDEDPLKLDDNDEENYDN